MVAEVRALSSAGQSGQVYVSITGLRVRSPWLTFRFWWHAIHAMMQVRRAPGCLSASARTINGVQHTLSVWQDDTAMREFVFSGAHLRAVRVFPKIATGKTFGYWADAPPDWDDVPALWEAHGQDYVGSR